MAKRTKKFDKTCFVISPIGKEGTDEFQVFREVLDYVVKPAVKAAGYDLEVIRADDIDRAGSFIRDILEQISASHVVIADLTGQNPNVFYELGVRHSLSSRTIMIAQATEDIPSDLREYRTIIYNSTPKGVAEFTDRIANYLKEIHEDPQRPDNPVLDRLDSVIGVRIAELESEVDLLYDELDSLLAKGKPETSDAAKPGMRTRLDRILVLMNAKGRYLNPSFLMGEGEDERKIEIPAEQGSFRSHTVSDNGTIIGFWYISGPHSEVDFVRELADTRVLMEQVSRAGGAIAVTFVVVSARDENEHSEQVNEQFAEIKKYVGEEWQDRFRFEIWDEPTITAKEYEYGIKVPAEKKDD